MNQIEAIALEGVAPYKQKVTFQIPLGISAIYGLNRAAGRASKNSNGSGKSRLMSAIPELLYEDPVIGERSDRQKLGTRALAFTNWRGRKVVVQRAAKGRSQKLEVVVDGKDLKARTPTLAKQALQKLWPLTAADYHTYVHIDSLRPHPLVRGTSIERKKFFTEFFGLNRMDVERKLYAAELSELNRVRSAFNELRTHWDEAKKDLLDPEAASELQAAKERLERKLSVLQQQFTEGQAVLRTVEFANNSKAQIKTLMEISGGTLDEGTFENLVTDNAKDLEEALESLDHARAFDGYRRETAAYERAASAIPERVQKLLNKYGDETLPKAKARAKVVRALESELELITDWLAEHKPVKGPGPAPEKSDRDRAELLDLAERYRHQIEHARTFKSGHCETCGQAVKVKDVRALNSKLAQIESELKSIADYVSWESRTQLATERNRDVKKYRAREAEIKIELARGQVWATAYDVLKDMPTKPEPFKGRKLQLSVCERMIDEIKERQALLQFMGPHVPTVIAFLELTEADLQMARDAATLSTRMTSIQNKLSRVSAKLEVHEQMRERAAKMRRRLKTMRERLEDEEPLRLLVKGYQDKNLKRMAVEAIGQRLMQLVNKYAKGVLPEDFRFEFRWNTEITIMVHRKGGETSDVRKLSGAESSLFSIVLVMALLAFVPSKKRCSLLVLDEPTAHAHPETSQALYDVLPALNRLIPSIVIITPKSDEVFPGAQPFTVIKTADGSAEIRPGFPNQQKKG